MQEGELFYEEGFAYDFLGYMNSPDQSPLLEDERENKSVYASQMCSLTIHFAEDTPFL